MRIIVNWSTFAEFSGLFIADKYSHTLNLGIPLWGRGMREIMEFRRRVSILNFCVQVWFCFDLGTKVFLVILFCAKISICTREMLEQHDRMLAINKPVMEFHFSQPGAVV